MPEAAQEAHARALATAPTVLENFFWGWLTGDDEARRLYFEELISIPDLKGRGDTWEDFDAT